MTTEPRSAAWISAAAPAIVQIFMVYHLPSQKNEVPTSFIDFLLAISSLSATRKQRQAQYLYIWVYNLFV